MAHNLPKVSLISTTKNVSRSVFYTVFFFASPPHSHITSRKQTFSMQHGISSSRSVLAKIFQSIRAHHLAIVYVAGLAIVCRKSSPPQSLLLEVDCVKWPNHLTFLAIMWLEIGITLILLRSSFSGTRSINRVNGGCGFGRPPYAVAS